MFTETSAKSGTNIRQLFKDLATSLPGMESTQSRNTPRENLFTFKADASLYSVDIQLAANQVEDDRKGICRC